MTIIEQIKAELERLKTVQLKRIQEGDLVDAEPYDKNEAYNELLSFLDTLESETTYDTRQYTPRPSVDIEDVARVQFASHVKVFDKKRKAVFDWEQFKEVAGIFYGFGKKDHSDTLESEKPMTQDGLEEEKSAIDLVAEERKRQISKGFNWRHDDEHNCHQLSDAAIVYAAPGPLRYQVMNWWPWDKKWLKEDDSFTTEGRIRELIKAGALIVAEIERLQRTINNYEKG